MLLTAFIWGTAFVAQSMATDYIGPWTYVFSRYIISATVLIPVSLISSKHYKPKEGEKKGSIRSYLLGGATCGLFLALASVAQQAGIKYTPAGKAGFITALYVVLVPVFSLIIGRTQPKKLWISVVLGVVGLYLISVKEGFSIASSDLLVILCAFIFAFQIMSVDHFSVRLTNPVILANIQFAVVAIITFFGMLTEHTPASAFREAGGSILYAGVLSGAVAYTLQIVAQKNVEPAVASLIMSLEAVFSVLTGFVVLHQMLTVRELVGCALLFLAVVIV